MTTPVTHPSGYSFVGLAKETVQGTAVAPTQTLMLNSAAQSKDNLEKLDDVGMRQSLSETYGAVPGAKSSELQMDGDVRVDSIGYLLHMILGDLETTGTGPYVHEFALLNTSPAQPPSYTFTDFSGVTASVGARAYAGSLLSELTLEIDPTKLITFSAKATGWGSVIPGAAPEPAVSAIAPKAGWQAAFGIGGPAAGGTQVKNIPSLSITITRALKVYHGLGTQQPFKIVADKVGVSGKFAMIAANEQALLDYLNNTQQAMQIVLNAGAAEIIQLDMSEVVYKATALNRGEEAVQYDVEWMAVGNTTDVGPSAGFSPIKVTLTNSVESY